MTQRNRIALSVVGALMFTVVTVLLGLRWFVGGMCANQLLAEIPSPDGALKALVFERDCGATTGFSTQISIVGGNGSLPSRAANLFVADTDHGKAPSGPGGGPELRVGWVGTHVLRVGRHRD